MRPRNVVGSTASASPRLRRDLRRRIITPSVRELGARLVWREYPCWRGRAREPVEREAVMTHLTFAEAIIVGLIQGTTELFPVSSLGHNVLIPALVGGSWANDLNVAKAESPYLAFVVGLHVATAIGITVYFWRDWVRIIGGFFTSLRPDFRRPVEIRTADQKLAWMIVVATIPVGLSGLLFEHEFRVFFGVRRRAAICRPCRRPARGQAAGDGRGDQGGPAPVVRKLLAGPAHRLSADSRV